MTRQDVAGTADQWLWAGSPNGGVVSENIDRALISADLSALTTQVMLSVGVPVQAGELVSTIWFLSGNTAAGTPTNYWAALYDVDGALMAQSADKTNTAWAGDTAKSFAITPVAAPVSGIYYAALMVKATTPPSLMGRSVNRAAAAGVIATGQKVLAQTSGSGLTTTAPATIATPTTVVNVPYVALR